MAQVGKTAHNAAKGYRSEQPPAALNAEMSNAMKTIGTPNNIDVLLHCYSCRGPHERIDAPAVQGAISELLDAGAIENVGDRIYTATALGKAWALALCNVPPPRNVFVDEQGRVLEHSIFI